MNPSKNNIFRWLTVLTYHNPRACKRLNLQFTLILSTLKIDLKNPFIFSVSAPSADSITVMLASPLAWWAVGGAGLVESAPVVGNRAVSEFARGAEYSRKTHLSEQTSWN